MVIPNKAKKHIVTSFRNLSPEMQEAVKQRYPLGFSEVMMRVDKPNGEFFYAVPFDTEEIAYLVKIDVKIDDGTHDDDEKDYYDDDIKGADDINDENGSDSSEGGGGGDDDDI